MQYIGIIVSSLILHRIKFMSPLLDWYRSPPMQQASEQCGDGRILLDKVRRSTDRFVKIAHIRTHMWVLAYSSVIAPVFISSGDDDDGNTNSNAFAEI